MAGGIQDGKQKPPLPQAGSSFIERIAGQGEVGGAGSGAETWGHGDPLQRRSPIDLRPLPVVRSASEQDYRAFVTTVIYHPHLARLPDVLHAPFLGQAFHGRYDLAGVFRDLLLQ